MVQLLEDRLSEQEKRIKEMAEALEAAKRPLEPLPLPLPPEELPLPQEPLPQEAKAQQGEVEVLKFDLQKMENKIIEEIQNTVIPKAFNANNIKEIVAAQIAEVMKPIYKDLDSQATKIVQMVKAQVDEALVPLHRWLKEQVTDPLRDLKILSLNTQSFTLGLQDIFVSLTTHWTLTMPQLLTSVIVTSIGIVSDMNNIKYYTDKKLNSRGHVHKAICDVHNAAKEKAAKAEKAAAEKAEKAAAEKAELLAEAAKAAKAEEKKIEEAIKALEAKENY